MEVSDSGELFSMFGEIVDEWWCKHKWEKMVKDEENEMQENMLEMRYMSQSLCMF